MQLLRLSIGALGPFASEHTIDLAELGASGLFLLEGPTGSGKSTLIDAIVFALYGKVASAGASEDRLRSDHAAPERETYVELVFSTGSGLYRVRRTPAYRRPKQRGSGTTLQQSTVHLYRLTSPDAPGELIANRLDEAGAELTRAIGLDRTQFVQTVVLPQGEFAAFLRADPEQRRGLLQRVFGTEVYERVQQRLERMRAEAARAVAAAELGVERDLARFWGAAGVAESEASPVEVAAGLAAEAAVAQEQAGAVARLARAAAEERDGLRGTAALLQRRDGLREALVRLEEVAPQHEAARVRLTAAEAAERVWAWVEGAVRAGRVTAEARAALDTVVARADRDLREIVGAGDPEIQLKALEAELDRYAQARGALVRALELENGLVLRRDEVASERSALGVAEVELAADRAALAELPRRRAALVAVLAPVHERAGGLAAARAAVADAEARVAAGVEAAGLGMTLAAAQRELVALTAAAQDAARALAAAHEARILGIAGELAAELVPGRACPVCGGTEHPAPAAPTPAPEQPVAQLASVHAAAVEALAAQAGEVEAFRERLAARTAAAGADPEDALTAARAVLADCTQAAEQDARIASELAALDAELETTRADLAVREPALAARATALARDEEALARDEAEVLVATDGAPSVKARDAELRRRTAQAKDWSAALNALVEAAAAEQRAERERDAALTEAGLDLDEVLRTRLPRADLGALRSAVDEHAAELARVGSALSELPADLPSAQDAGAALAAAEGAAEEAERAAREATASAAVLGERAAAAAQALTGLGDALTSLDEARQAAAPVTRMANLAAASGGEGALTLATYVLGQRFEDLVAAANARLGQMSDGRYELVRSAEKEDVRTRRIGLALRVVDHRTGVARDPRTLSGGETFYVSLCLALGLADVVRAEAGGIELGTLLVDEGFGSLDAETLDVVLGELSRLRDGGRVVGVVSHVDTLKQAIAERIEIRRLPDGASTLAVRC